MAAKHNRICLHRLQQFLAWLWSADQSMLINRVCTVDITPLKIGISSTTVHNDVLQYVPTAEDDQQLCNMRLDHKLCLAACLQHSQALGHRVGITSTSADIKAAAAALGASTLVDAPQMCGQLVALNAHRSAWGRRRSTSARWPTSHSTTQNKHSAKKHPTLVCLLRIKSNAHASKAMHMHKDAEHTTARAVRCATQQATCQPTQAGGSTL